MRRFWIVAVHTLEYRIPGKRECPLPGRLRHVAEQIAIVAEVEDGRCAFIRRGCYQAANAIFDDILRTTSSGDDRRHARRQRLQDDVPEGIGF